MCLGADLCKFQPSVGTGLQLFLDKSQLGRQLLQQFIVAP